LIIIENSTADVLHFNLQSEPTGTDTQKSKSANSKLSYLFLQFDNILFSEQIKDS